MRKIKIGGVKQRVQKAIEIQLKKPRWSRYARRRLTASD